jgi:ATP adenylyltransferase
VSLDRIFAGWRNAYVSGVAQVEPVAGDCVFCALFAADVTDRERLVVHRGERCVVMLNLYPYGSGHLLVMPLRHIAALTELDDAERAEFFDTVVDASAALQKAYDPDGMNVGANLGRAAGAGVPGHLHFHALPRWGGDTNFMTSLAEARVINEELATTYDKIRHAWPN